MTTKKKIIAICAVVVVLGGGIGTYFVVSGSNDDSSSVADSSSKITYSYSFESEIATVELSEDVGKTLTSKQLAGLILGENKVTYVKTSSAESEAEVDTVLTSSVIDNSEFTFDFKDGAKELKLDEVGTKTVTVTVSNVNDGVSADLTATIEVVDQIAPEITGVSEKSMNEGSKSTLTKGISATDNYDKDVEVSVSVDGKAVTKAHAFSIGEHEVTYTAKDSSGNKTTKTTTLTINQIYFDADEYKYVNVDTLKVFKEYSGKNELGTLKLGDKLHITATVKGKKAVRIEYKDGVAYVNSDKLTDSDPTYVAPQEQTYTSNNTGNNNNYTDNNNNYTDNNNNGGNSGNTSGGSSNNGGGTSNGGSTSGENDGSLGKFVDVDPNDVVPVDSDIWW